MEQIQEVNTQKWIVIGDWSIEIGEGNRRKRAIWISV